jgi:hypothetical protein
MAVMGVGVAAGAGGGGSGRGRGRRPPPPLPPLSTIMIKRGPYSIRRAGPAA